MAINELTDEQVEQSVRSILSFHKGKENKISRWQLVEQVFGREAAANRGNNNLYDRRIREAISKYRETDLIVSWSGTDGYWLAADMNDIDMIASEYEKRSVEMLSKAKRLRQRGIEQLGPQMPLL